MVRAKLTVEQKARLIVLRAQEVAKKLTRMYERNELQEIIRQNDEDFLKINEEGQTEFLLMSDDGEFITIIE